MQNYEAFLPHAIPKNSDFQSVFLIFVNILLESDFVTN